MGPSFRSDLNCVREEQQGVVFYRIDDPETQTSFRLYEIEYLIAQKLDGSRGLDEVISAVKSEYNFDITRPDLDKFVSQLQSMGFVRGDDDGDAVAVAPVAPEAVRPGDTPAPLVPQADGASVSAGDTAASEFVTDEPTTTHVGALGADVADGEAVEDIEPMEATDDDADDASVSQIGSFQDVPMPSEAFGVGDTPLPDFDAGAPPVMADADPGLDRDAELHRLLRSALLHLKQGYVVHAREFFQAAKELDPENPGLLQLVGQVEALGDETSPAQIERLWADATGLYPNIAAEVGPLLEGQQGGGDEEGHRGMSLRSRMLWATVLSLALVAAGGGVYWLMLATGVLQDTAEVRIVSLKAESVPIFFPTPAEQVATLSDRWLSFGEAGTVGAVRVKAGDRVAEGAIVASLVLKKPMEKKLERAQQAVSKAQESYDQTVKALEALLAERTDVEAERDAAQGALKKLRPESILKRGGVSKRDFEKHKRAVVKANKKLSQLAKKERRPRGQEKKARKRLEAARRKLGALEQRLGGRLVRAPFAGEVVAVEVMAGAEITPDTRVVHLRDPSAVRLAFNLADAADLQPGGEAHVVVASGAARGAKVATITPRNNGVRVQVDVVDPEGGLVEQTADQFQLVRQFVDSAFSIPAGAIVEGADGTPRVVVAQQGRATLRSVDVLQNDGSHATIRDPSGGLLGDGDRVVVERLRGGAVNSIDEQTVLKVR